MWGTESIVISSHSLVLSWHLEWSSARSAALLKPLCELLSKGIQIGNENIAEIVWTCSGFYRPVGHDAPGIHKSGLREAVHVPQLCDAGSSSQPVHVQHDANPFLGGFLHEEIQYVPTRFGLQCATTSERSRAFREREKHSCMVIVCALSNEAYCGRQICIAVFRSALCHLDH